MFNRIWIKGSFDFVMSIYCVAAIATEVSMLILVQSSCDHSVNTYIPVVPELPILAEQLAELTS